MFREPTVYPVVDVDVCRRHAVEPVATVEACLRGGARVLQIRWKGAPGGPFLQLARSIVSAAAPFGAAVVVNDRWDVARLAGAPGVHVGQEDLPVESIHLAAPALAVGVSTHTPDQVDAAVGSACAYVAVGPIYGTVTKDTGYSARGLDLVRYAAGRGKPIVAIGGITLDHVPELLRAGAGGLAVISDLLVTGNAEQRVRAYIDACRRSERPAANGR